MGVIHGGFDCKKIPNHGIRAPNPWGGELQYFIWEFLYQIITNLKTRPRDFRHRIDLHAFTQGRGIKPQYVWVFFNCLNPPGYFAVPLLGENIDRCITWYHIGWWVGVLWVGGVGFGRVARTRVGILVIHVVPVVAQVSSIGYLSGYSSSVVYPKRHPSWRMYSSVLF